MRVRELIEKLQEMDQDAVVLLWNQRKLKWDDIEEVAGGLNESDEFSWPQPEVYIE